MFLKEYRIQITLILSLLFVGLLPFLPLINERAVTATIFFALFLGIYAAWYKAKVDVWIPLIIALSLLVSRYVFDKVDDYTLLLRVMGNLGFVFFSFTLLIGPWSRFSGVFLDFYKHRRHLGVTTFFLGLIHGSLIFFKPYFGSYSLKAAFQATFVFYGFTALFIMSLLAITSWDYIQKHVSLKAWNIIHALLFLVFLGLTIYFYNVAGGLLKFWQKGALGFFLIFWLLVAPWSISRKLIYVVNGWKQLHVLIYLAYVSTVIHVATGALIEAPIWVKGVFWSIVGVVFLSHAVGWFFGIREYLKRMKSKVEAIDIDGTLYYALAPANSFLEGVGRKFYVNGVPIAVFLYKGKIFAMSNVCKHQKGPIYLGKIRNNYVECPWHNWQYHVSDGCGPPGYADCIPYYPVRVQDGMTYVSLKPILKSERKVRELSQK